MLKKTLGEVLGKQILLLLFLNSIFSVFIAWGNWRINQIVLEQQKPSNCTNEGKVASDASVNRSVSGEQFDLPPLTLEQIFSSDLSWIDQLPRERIRTILTTGDVMLGRSVNARSIKNNDFLWFFEKTAEILKGADLTLINLESPFFSKCQPTNEGMKFCSDLRNIEGLTFAGIDIVNLANNHIGDFGPEGIDETVRLIDKTGIKMIGLTEPVYQDIKGMVFAFLGYCPVCDGGYGFEGTEREKLVMEIEKARQTADLVIVSFHWGEEYVEQPNQRQIELAHLAIDSGADLIIGHHPHWIQPVEVYKGKLIAYSLGNFIFDQNWSEETKRGLALRFTFQDKQLAGIEMLPVLINNSGQPEFAIGEDKEKIINELKEVSFELAKT